MSFQAQSLFNFGVVPTFTILFIIMGFGASFALSTLEDHKDTERIND